MTLATDLKLSIDLWGGEWLRITLKDDLNLSEVAINYRVICTTLDKSYHMREGLVIAARRVLQAALDQGMISDYHGELTTVTKIESGLPDLLPTSIEEDSTQSLIDLEFP
jgi:hypothetical protein